MIELLEGLYETSGSGGGTNKRKYGATVDTFLGEVSSDGLLRVPSENTDLVFTGVKSIASQALMYKFYNCCAVSLSFPDLEKLHTASSCEQAFVNGSLESVSFPKCTEITGSKCLASAFVGNLHLESVSFPVLADVGVRTDQFDNMLQGITGCTVHFPADMESTLENFTSVQNGFGGTNTVVLYDL